MMSSTSKRRRIIAYQSRRGSDVIILYRCGDCQCYFPSLHTIHRHYKSCVDNLNITSCRSDSSLAEPPPLPSDTINSKGSLLDETSSSTTAKSKHSNRDQSQRKFKKSHPDLDVTSDEINVDLFDNSNEKPDLVFNEITTESVTVLGSNQIDDSHEILTEHMDVSAKKQHKPKCINGEIENESMNTSNEQDCLDGVKSVTLDSSESSISKSDENSDIFLSENELNIERFGKNSCTDEDNIRKLHRESISLSDKVDQKENTVTSDTQGLCTDRTDCRLIRGIADSFSFQCTVPEDIVVDKSLKSNNRKRKYRDEQTCHTNTSQVPSSLANIHSSEKYPNVVTEQSMNEEFVYEKCDKGHSDVEENVTTFKCLEYTNQRAYDNFDVSDSSDRQSSIGNIHKRQRIDRQCSGEKNEEITTLNNETLMVGKKNCYVSEEMALVPSSSKNGNLLECRERYLESNNIGTESIKNDVLDPLKSILSIKCEDTGKCVASINTLSGNLEEEIITNLEFSSRKEKRELVSEPETLSENVGQIHTNRYQNENFKNESRLKNANDNVKRNQSRVLVTYNENENVDLDLECEDNSPFVENDLCDETNTLDNPQENRCVDFPLDSRKQNRGPYLNGEEALSISQYKLKRLSVTVERLDISSFKKRKSEESHAAQNGFSLRSNVNQGNTCICPEVKEQCMGICQNFITKIEAVAQPVLTDSIAKTCNEDKMSKGYSCNRDNSKLDISSVRHFEEYKTDKTDHQKGLCKDDFKECKTDKTDHQKDLRKEYQTDHQEDVRKEDLEEGSDEPSEKSEHCDKCNTHFTSLTCYINHLLLFHHPAYTRNDLAACPICPHNLYNSYFNSSLKSHLRFAHELDEMKCIRCRMKFDTNIDLHKHIKACRVNLQKRPPNETYLYTKTVQCKNCKTFHIYRPSNNKEDVLKDIIQTLPDDSKLNIMKEKDKKFHGNIANHTSKYNLKCKICNIEFNRLSCGLNHAITAHMKENLKTKCSLFKRTKRPRVCGVCNKRHKIIFFNVKKRKLRRLMKQCEKGKDASKELNSNDMKLNANDKKVLTMIRDGLCTYYGYKNDKWSKGNLFCKTCNTSFGPFLCGLNHMIVTHFDRDRIDIVMKSSFFHRRDYRCGHRRNSNICSKVYRWHYFSVQDVDKLKRYLENESDVNTYYEKEVHLGSELSPACTESSLIKKLQEILVNDIPTFSYSLDCIKTSVNVAAAKTKEEISNDMEYRIAYKNGFFLCRLCHSEYVEYSCCKCHVLTEHAPLFSYRVGSEVYTCPECVNHFHTLHGLDVHLKNQHNVYRFACLKCEEEFNTCKEYNTHVRHENYIKTNFNEKISCKECGLIHSCVVQDGEIERITSISSENETALKYVQPNQTKQENSLLRSDTAAHLEYEKGSYSDVAFDGEKFVCLVCLQRFEKLTCCFTHTVMHHHNRGELICSICFQKSSTKLAYISHMRNNHGLDANYCRHCYKGFEEIILRDKHAGVCQTQTNEIPENVDENLCRTCFSVHIYVSEGDKSLSCKDCKLGFASIACARNHFYINHFPTWVILASAENAFRCPCGKDVLTKSELMLHLKNDHPSEQKKTKTSQGETIKTESLEKLQYNDYDSYFKAYEDLDGKCVACEHVHIIASNSGGVKNSKRKTCKVCQKSFFTSKCLQNHILVAHTHEFQPRQCVGCSLHFGGLRTLKCHQGSDITRNVQSMQGSEDDVERICPRKITIVKCPDCGEIHQHKFSSEEKKLKNANSPEIIRKKRKGESHKKVYKCITCSLVVANYRDLRAHRNSDHGKIKDEKGAICQVCRRKIDSNLFYSEHLKQEHCSLNLVDGEFLDDFYSNFSCVYCEKTFSFVADVQLHLRSVHFEKPLAARKHYRPELEGILKNGLRILQCPICFIMFKQSQHVPFHINSHFNEVSTKDSKSNTCVCDICGKSFTCKTSLIQHKNSHTGIRKYKCGICEKSFMYSPNLDAHALVHREKKEVCKVCGMKFTLPHHVRAHVKRKHPDHA